VNIEAQTKACTRCLIVRPFDEFSRDSARRDGRQGTCKVCFKEIRKDRPKKGRRATAVRAAKPNKAAYDLFMGVLK
jgi:hypothetical protein